VTAVKASGNLRGETLEGTAPMKLTSPLTVITAAALLGVVLLTGAASADVNRQSEPVPADPLDAFKPMSEIDVDLRIVGKELPTDESKDLFTPPEPYSRAAMGRGAWPEIDFAWEAPELFYQPLYFDDAPLERYGQTCCRPLQPAVSGVHFFGTVLLMPYRLIENHPYGCISQLGYYRQGSPAPPVGHRVRLSVDPRWLHPLGYWLCH
jgi:hypothetical protein